MFQLLGGVEGSPLSSGARALKQPPNPQGLAEEEAKSRVLQKLLQAGWSRAARGQLAAALTVALLGVTEGRSSHHPGLLPLQFTLS